MVKYVTCDSTIQEWFDYDENLQQPISISDMEYKFTRL